MLAADLAVGVPSDELARYMDQPQPTCLPPEPVAWLGTNAVIRWHELHAGREG
ncbi:MAG: hypothetical protein U1E59_19925 [Amaricoccus sp.]